MSEIKTSKLANTEIVIKPRTDNEIKEYILNIRFDTITISKSLSEQIVKKITGEIDGDELTGTHEFLYHEILEDTKFKDDDINKYITSCKTKLASALNIPKILKGFSHHILTLDGITDEYEKKALSRYQKLKRLEYMFDILVRQSLTIINNFYWSDFINGKYGVDIIEDCIKKATPIIIYLKHQIEDQVRNELKYDADDEALISLHRNYK